MILTLLIMAIVCVGSLVATMLMGLGYMTGNHILWAIFAVPFGLFTLTVHMFYFIGTGSDVKKALAKHDVAADVRREVLLETAQMKKRTFPILLWSMLFLMVTFVLGGAVYIETVFQWPGVGLMLVQAISKRDILLVQGGVVIVAASYVLINLLADLAQGWLDPRVKT